MGHFCGGCGHPTTRERCDWIYDRDTGAPHYADVCSNERCWHHCAWFGHKGRRWPWPLSLVQAYARCARCGGDSVRDDLQPRKPGYRDE